MFHENKKLIRLLKGKSLCFVGPATTLEGSKAGKDIDKFDYVIRTNDSAFMDSSHYDDYGSKTDIVYLNNAFLKRKLGMKNKLDKKVKNLINLLHDLKSKNVKIIIVKGDQTKKLIESALRSYSKVKKIKIDILVEVSSKKWQTGNLRNLWKKDRSKFFEPTLAVYVLSDVIQIFPKLLYVTGMDFYTGTSHWYGTYNEQVSQKKAELERRQKHHVLGDLEYLQYLKSACKFIKFDSVLNQFLAN